MYRKLHEVDSAHAHLHTYIQTRIYGSILSERTHQINCMKIKKDKHFTYVNKLRQHKV